MTAPPAGTAGGANGPLTSRGMIGAAIAPGNIVPGRGANCAHVVPPKGIADCGSDRLRLPRGRERVRASNNKDARGTPVRVLIDVLPSTSLRINTRPTDRPKADRKTSGGPAEAGGREACGPSVLSMWHSLACQRRTAQGWCGSPSGPSGQPRIVSTPPSPADPPEEPTRPLPPATPPPARVGDEREVAAPVEDPYRTELLLDQLRSLRTALAIVGLIAVAALAVAVYTVLTKEEESDTGAGASRQQVADLAGRVDALEADVKTGRPRTRSASSPTTSRP